MGIVNFDGAPINVDLCLNASRLLAHRGPNDEGFVVGHLRSGEHVAFAGPATPNAVYGSGLPYIPSTRLSSDAVRPFSLALINRRLSIQDLSPAGHLPMCTPDRKVWLAFNGQVYNFVELRSELVALGHEFVSAGDSEVILHSYREWGTRCFERFNGMWAIALWDIDARTLLVSRDRLGVKPLYYWRGPRSLAFASEIKCLFALGAPRDVHQGVIYDYLAAGAVDHTEDTFFRSVGRFPAASTMTVRCDGAAALSRFWDFQVTTETESHRSDDAHAQEFRELFSDSVAIRLRSDVPLGSCLSGGLDSSAIVAVADHLVPRGAGARSSFQHVTFSSCFEGSELDEREFINVVARQTNVETNYVFPTADGFWNDLEAFVWHQEEPVGGTSQYAQWCVMRRAAERGITVMLDGQGADEQLLGYRKFLVYHIMHLLRRRAWRSAFLEAGHVLAASEILKTTNFRSGLRYSALGRRVQTSTAVLHPDLQREQASRPLAFEYGGHLGDRIRQDLLRLSLPALLRYEDKSSMAHSVEARLPFLDYRLVEMIAALPLNQKIRRGWTKFVMRNAFQGVLPEAIRRRRSKRGFSTPEREWFKILAPRLETTFKDAKFLADYVNSKALKRHFARFRAGSELEDQQFFCRCLLLERWGQQFVQGDPSQSVMGTVRRGHELLLERSEWFALPQSHVVP